ncbi:hypothetical protein AGMMS50268_08040 [Spirochaetia bacterium]|nr:hypothetical protein AGMMS50268_08040 [Spirochaetia bacterium]
MNSTGKRLLFCLFFSTALSSLSLWAANYDDGRIRLILNEDTGRFSLYYMTDVSRKRYEALFTDQDPRTSMLTINLNDKQFRLGDSNAFKISIGGTWANPSLVFESPLLLVTEEFSFIKTAGSPVTNGIKITLTIESKSFRRADVGFRLLLDTSLGENGPAAPFITDQRSITAETAFDSTTSDQWWLTHNDHLSFAGSMSAGLDRKPDLVHIANWKRLNDAPWKMGYSPGRNFNYPPLSIGDSAVAYYFDPRRLARGETVSYSLLLAAEHSAESARWSPLDTGNTESFAGGLAAYTPAHEAAVLGQGAVQTDLGSLRDMIVRIDALSDSDSPIRDEELAALEREISRLKSRYGTP